jgi:3-oxoacyl-[acyl-carrier protein] reductase
MQIKDSTFLITGGSSGIGRAAARMIIDKGGKAAITARGKGRLEKTAKEIGAYPINTDVSKPGDIEKTYNLFFKKFGKLDCLINNAGISGGGEVDTLKWEDFEKVYSVNVFGAALMSQKAAEIFKKQKYGNIINIGSTAGVKGYAGGSVYASSKFALRGLTICWQAELRRFNVRVMCINPSEVRTSFGGIETEEVSNRLRGEEIAHAIISSLEMDDRGFIPEFMVWATNPF